MNGILICAVLRVPPEGLEDFCAYEDLVLPMLADHGGTLERRLRSDNGTVEIHLIRFSNQAGFDAFRDDPRRAAHAYLFNRSRGAIEVMTVDDVQGATV